MGGWGGGGGAWAFALLILSHFSKISHENEIIWSKLFHFHRIFKNRGQGGGSREPPEPLLDQQLALCMFTRN